MEIIVKLDLGGGLADMLSKKKSKKTKKPTEDEILEAQMVFGDQITEEHVKQIRKRRKARGDYDIPVGFNADELIGLAEAIREEEEERR